MFRNVITRGIGAAGIFDPCKDYIPQRVNLRSVLYGEKEACLNCMWMNIVLCLVTITTWSSTQSDKMGVALCHFGV